MAVEEDQEMPLTEHIDELVTRLLVVLIVMAVVAVATYFISIETNMIRAMWNNFLPGTKIRGLSPWAEIITRLKLSALTGIAFAIPVLVYQTFMFMRPGLYENEQRYFLAVVPMSVILLAVGLIVSYFLFLPLLFSYFRAYSDSIAKQFFGLTETFNLILFLSLALGIVFQIPLVIFLAVKMRVTSREWLASKRILAWIGFGTISITVLGTLDPSGVSGFAMAGIMIFLFEITLFMLKFTDTGKSSDSTDFSTEPDSDFSPDDTDPGGGSSTVSNGAGTESQPRGSNDIEGEGKEPEDFDVVPTADARYQPDDDELQRTEETEEYEESGEEEAEEFEDEVEEEAEEFEDEEVEEDGVDEVDIDFDDLKEIDGVGPAYEDRMKEAGIDSLYDLAEADPEELSEEIDVTEKWVNDWVDHAKKLVE